MNQIVQKSSPSNRQNVSFKFTKITAKALTGNRLDEENKDFVVSVDKSEIKSTLAKPKPAELVIPLIKKNNWRNLKTTKKQENASENESELNNLAVQELLKESSEKNAQWENREFSNMTVAIPLIVQNKIPEGYETDDKLNVSLRAEQSTIEDYDKVPIEQFGMALIRGMGWKEGEGIGNNNKKPVELKRRPKGLGLGGDASVLKKNQEKAKEEKLELTKGAYVNIIQGQHKGYYGEVLGLDEENARVIVKLTTDEKVTLPEFFIKLVSKKEFNKESRIINRATYEKYKREEEKKEKNERHSIKRERSDDLDNSKHERKETENGHSEGKNSRKPEKRSKRHHSRERSEEKHRTSKSSQTWVKPQLRVRFINDKYQKGKFFNEKMVVVDVMSSKSCFCKTDDGRILDDISPSMLETVIPRHENAYVMIVQGKYSGE
ncbi:g-patch domain and KOW motifs-containing protein, partial [Caerostris extrusa]